MEEKKESREEKVEVDHVVHRKPKLTEKQKRLLKMRTAITKRRPVFIRQEYWRYKRLRTGYRRPRGIHSKMRRHYKYRPVVVSIGYRGPAEVRGYHPTGFKDILVHNKKELEHLNPEIHAIRIGSTVGTRKRFEIEDAATAKGFHILNKLKGG